MERRGGRQYPRLRASLSGRHHHQARRELPKPRKHSESGQRGHRTKPRETAHQGASSHALWRRARLCRRSRRRDRKSTRLNSSHVKISYAVFCLKKKKKKRETNKLKT